MTMVRKALSDKRVFELRPEGLKERAADTKGVFRAKAKTWDHLSLAYVFRGRRSASLEQKEQGGSGSMKPEVE